MKTAGIALLAISVMLLAFSGLLLSQSGVSQSVRDELAQAERDLDFCQSVARSCEASRQKHNRALAKYASAHRDPTVLYISAGTGVFVMLLGTLLYSAGRIETAIQQIPRD